MNAATFLTLRCLYKLDCEDGAKFSDAKGLIIDNTYIEDIFVGTDSVGDLLPIQNDLVRLLRR